MLGILGGMGPMATVDFMGREAEALAARGCSHIAMACTEIPLALATLDSDIGAALLDPTDLLARACVRSCLAAPQEAMREVAWPFPHAAAGALISRGRMIAAAIASRQRPAKACSMVTKPPCS